MNIREKIRYLQDHHMNDWLNTRKIVDVELSNNQGIFCVCGRLATGMHERSCTRFNNKVNSETVKRLKRLINTVRHKDCGTISNEGVLADDVLDYLCPVCNVTFLDNDEQTITS